MRDAIVVSGWNWENYNAPERVALALARLGARVLYVETSLSMFRHRGPVALKEVDRNIYALRPRHWANRLNQIPPLKKMQETELAAQVIKFASQLALNDPFFIYCNQGGRLDFCAEMKKHFFSVLLRIDYHEAYCGPRVEWASDRCVELSDLVLVIPKSAYHRLRAKFGAKVHRIPQSVDFAMIGGETPSPIATTAALADVPRPRLGYLGIPDGRLNETLLYGLLSKRPQWHFVSVGASAVALPNAHTVPRVRPEELAGYLHGIDVTVLPYNSYNEQWLHCMPLKVLEAFSLGIPVASVPLVNLWEYEDLIYFGDTSEEFARAVQSALDEPLDSPKRRRRKEVARDHSIEALAQRLSDVLPLQGVDPPAIGDTVLSRESPGVAQSAEGNHRKA